MFLDIRLILIDIYFMILDTCRLDEYLKISNIHKYLNISDSQNILLVVKLSVCRSKIGLLNNGTCIEECILNRALLCKPVYVLD